VNSPWRLPLQFFPFLPSTYVALSTPAPGPAAASALFFPWPSRRSQQPRCLVSLPSHYAVMLPLPQPFLGAELHSWPAPSPTQPLPVMQPWSTSLHFPCHGSRLNLLPACVPLRSAPWYLLGARQNAQQATCCSSSVPCLVSSSSFATALLPWKKTAAPCCVTCASVRQEQPRRQSMQPRRLRISLRRICASLAHRQNPW
jgi:hypothetical protein